MDDVAGFYHSLAALARDRGDLSGGEVFERVSHSEEAERLYVSFVADVSAWLGQQDAPKRMKSRKRDAPEFLTDDVLSALYASIPEESVEQKRDKAAVMLLEGAGLRVGEALALRGGDVTFEQGVMMVRVPNVEGCKTGARTVPVNLGHPVVERIRPLLEPDVPVFRTRSGVPIHSNQVRRVLADAGAKIGVHVRPHMLRHTYGTNGVEYYTLPELRDLMGHKSLSTTSIYLHSNPVALAAKERARKR